MAATKARSKCRNHELEVVREKEQDLGRILTIQDEEYVKLQVEKYIIVKDRPDTVKKELQSLQNKIKKKRKILDKTGTDVCKVLEVKKVAKSGVESRLARTAHAHDERILANLDETEQTRRNGRNGANNGHF